MSAPSFSRRRERQEKVHKNLIQMGLLRKKVDSTGVTVQTIPINVAPWSLANHEVTWDTLHKGPPYLSGGPFASMKAVFDVNSIKGVGFHRSANGSAGGGFHWEYTGGFGRPYIPSLDSVYLNSYINMSVDNPYDLDTLTSNADIGPSAYDKLRPRMEEAGLGVFIAELRDFSGMLSTSAAFFRNRWESLGGNRFLKTMAGSPKEASDHFLNHSFGWVPFISDLQKAYAVWQKQDELIRRLTDGNGIWLKRTRVISKTDSFQTTVSQNSIGIPWRDEFNAMCNAFPGTSAFFHLTRTESINAKVWANAEFTYYRPEFDAARSGYESNWKQAMRLLSLYGIRINPSFLWKITPWTWLLDWFAGFGTYLDRIQSYFLDGVVSKQMYIMERSVKESQHIVDVNWKTGVSTFSWSNIVETKQRELAESPFSYSLPVGGLSPKQLAILAALGLSRLAP